MAVRERSRNDPFLVVDGLSRSVSLAGVSLLARTARAAVTSGLIRLIRSQPRRIARVP